MNLVLFDLPDIFERFLPLTFTRPVSLLRAGILTIADKWEYINGNPVSFLTAKHLQHKYRLKTESDNLLINSTVFPDHNLYSRLLDLHPGQCLYHGKRPIGFFATGKQALAFQDSHDFSPYERIDYHGSVLLINHIYDLFNNNGGHIRFDVTLLNPVSTGKINDPHTLLYGKENIFVGKDIRIKAGILDAETGPVWIGNNVTIQPGSIITGPVAILDGSIISSGSNIRPNTTVGPGCKVGGEVSQVVFQGNSNKSHDGFLGSSVIGEWCNFGAGSNNSNLKNNYGSVKLWDYGKKDYADTGLQYCGLIMADHTKCGINTMFNTGTIAGVSANIFGAGYMPKFIPSFSWGGQKGFETYAFTKAIQTAQAVMERRSATILESDRIILEHIFKFSAPFREKSTEK